TPERTPAGSARPSPRSRGPRGSPPISPDGWTGMRPWRTRIMRTRFKPSAEQRSALRTQLARLQDPAVVLEHLRPSLPVGFQPAGVVCAVESVHSDRFVVRARVRSHNGRECAFALKAYSDDFGLRVWAHARDLDEHF